MAMYHACPKIELPARRSITCSLRIAGFVAAIVTASSLSMPVQGNDDPQASIGKDQQQISFNRDVRPILSDKCFRCHGADQNTREADLRLDLKDSALADRDGHRVVAPGKPEDSELLRRISSDDESQRMPPVDEPLQLSRHEIELLRRWIEQGATYEQHWSFISPSRSAPREVQRSDWSRGAIDDFVLARLEAETLSPATER